MSDDDYIPAKRPPDAVGGDRVRFESEGGVEQSIFGGSAADIEQSILEDTFINTRLIGAKIMSVRTVKGDLGSGTLQELTLTLDSGLIFTIRGIGLEVGIE